jgi:6-pyruvoyltetrahydropterin/6-carboxytetrahydropterin synthase
VFAASHLDERNWVVDFGPGGFGKIKDWLTHMFDHTFLVAEDDPHIEAIKALPNAEVRIVPAAGCEATAKLAFDFAQAHIHAATNGRCWVESVECFEHGSNSAIYRNPFASVLEAKAVADIVRTPIA